MKSRIEIMEEILLDEFRFWLKCNKLKANLVANRICDELIKIDIEVERLRRGE